MSKPTDRQRPPALPAATRRDIAALAPAKALDRWDAGLRALSSGDNVVTMFDVIGEDYWSGGGVTAKKVASQLRAIGDRPVEVQINSPGGDMFEGLAIYNVLREHPQPVTVKVMGVAASAASIVAMAGDDVRIGAAGFLMIHNCWVLAVGNRHDMADLAAWLAPFDAAMATVYQLRSGQDLKAISSWMDDEAWMGGALAVERGFADGLLESDETVRDPAASAAGERFNAARRAELALCASMSRSDARALIAKLKTSDGTPGAAVETGTPGAAPTPPAADPGAGDWLAGVRDLAATLRSS